MGRTKTQKVVFALVALIGLLLLAYLWVDHANRKSNRWICATFLHVLQDQWRKAGSPTGKELDALLRDRGNSEYFSFTNSRTIGGATIQFQFGLRDSARLGTNGFVAVATDGRVFWIGVKTNDVFEVRRP
jgi:hypothetical protein